LLSQNKLIDATLAKLGFSGVGKDNGRPLLKHIVSACSVCEREEKEEKKTKGKAE
jgi:hypothetical protein